jgi:hypothetical protein
MQHHIVGLRLSVLGALGVAACSGGTVKTGGTCHSCDGSTPVTDAAGNATGFEECDDGSFHRVSATALVPVVADTCAGTEDTLNCTTAADCTDKPNAMCRTYTDSWDTGIDPATSCSCTYVCATDADCGEGQACVTPGMVRGQSSWNTCVPALCVTDADCGGCGECGVSTWDDGCGASIQLACRTKEDTCRAEDECSDGLGCGLNTYDEAVTAWSCGEWNCAIGRPLLVGGVARTAVAEPRADWAATAVPRPVDAVTASALAAHWARVGAMEHASVASFARFTLQMMAVGAPAHLLGATQLAAADEVEHAQLCYGLASAYGDEVGPGPLPIDGVIVATAPEAVVRSLVAEACVGETLGVAEAREAASLCEDPAVTAVLVRIADDEQRHAELAWRVLSWMCEDPGLRAVAVEALQEAIDALGTSEGEGLHLPESGVLGPRFRAALHLEVAEGVLRPALDALTGSEALHNHAV